MSRHLMARFRHLHAATAGVNWQDGFVLPETAFHMEDYNEYKDKLGFGPRAAWEPKHVSTAIVHHGERMHALQVNHETEIVDEPHLWSLHVHNGTDPKEGGWEHLDLGNHDQECDLCEAGPGEKCHSGCWDQNSHTGGGMRNTREDTQWQDGTGGEFWGWQPDRESAQKAAETAWANYTGDNGSGLGDVDVDAIGRQHDVSGPKNRPADDDYGDFSGLFGGGR